MESSSILWVVFSSALIYFIGTVVVSIMGGRNASGGAAAQMMMRALTVVGVALFLTYVFGAGRLVGAIMAHYDYQYWVMPGVYWAITIYAGLVTACFGLIRNRNVVLIGWTILSLVITTLGLGILGMLTVTK